MLTGPSYKSSLSALGMFIFVPDNFFPGKNDYIYVLYA